MHFIHPILYIFSYMEFFGFVVIGLLAGLFAGLLGIGGGIVTIPCLVFVFSKINIPSGLVMHLAIGTSLASMVFNTLSASTSHYKKRAVNFSILRPMGFGIVIGSALGAYVAKLLSGDLLKIFFGMFECLLGFRFLLPQRIPKKLHQLPAFWGLSGIALFVSTISTILGVGGGLLNVPILTHYHVPIKEAIGTSSALSFLISLLGAIFFLLLGLHRVPEAESFGYIYLPAFVTISAVSFLVAPWGVKLAHILPKDVLRKIFGGALLAAGLFMLIK